LSKLLGLQRIGPSLDNSIYHQPRGMLSGN